MKADNASSTAYFIAESMMMLSKDVSLMPLVPRKAVELSEAFVGADPRSSRLVSRIKRQRVFSSIFSALVNLVIPGIRNHYLVRKLRIEEVTRQAIKDGVTQIVVLGAGFDTLALRLARIFPDISFIEADHPATQSVKLRAVEKESRARNIHFIPIDISIESLRSRLIDDLRFVSSRRTLFVAEGLLMYLRQDKVEEIFDFVREQCPAGSKILFSFLEQGPGGRITFQNSSALLDLWLKMHGEPFTWGVSRNDLDEFLDERGFIVEDLNDEAAFRRRYLNAPKFRKLRLAQGELLCLASASGRIVNDIHSKLNETRVACLLKPRAADEIRSIVDDARVPRHTLSVAGGFHAMGGQQFLTGSILLDMSAMNAVISFEPEKLLIEVESGITWDKLIVYTTAANAGLAEPVGIRQKQTGADRLSIGGALAANIHGRGLFMKPFIDDVESFRMVTADGVVRECSRWENTELFHLAIGGYGLFGVVISVKLRLTRREKVRRNVTIKSVDDLPELFALRIENGYTYGDFQFAIAPETDAFLRKGVFSCYCPVPLHTKMETDQKSLSDEDWKTLLYLAHTDKQRAFDLYSSYYASTDGQVYWSDSHQLSTYLDDYHAELDVRLGSPHRGSEMITELYVPLLSLPAFLAAVRQDFRENNVDLIYGTIRLIDRDEESFLAWAGEFYACIVFNLHIAHTPKKIEKAKLDFRRLIDRAIEFGGSYYLTYHAWAAKEQILRCYPQLPDFLDLKLKYDPHEKFQNNWYRGLREALK